MKYALASQSKNTIGGCVKRWQQTVNNRNHWQVDDGWSTAGTFVTFPGPKIDTLKAFISGRDVIVLLPTGFGKSLIFQLFWEAELVSNPNTCILVVAPLTGIVEDQISVKWGWQTYKTLTVRGICTFAVFFSVSRPFMSLHSCLWRALCVVLLRKN